MIMGIDTSQFYGLIDKFKNTTSVNARKKAIFAGLSQLKTDANEKEPQTPHLEGNLRSNVEIKVVNDESGRLKFKEPYAERWEKAKGNIDPITGAKITWSEEGVGPEYAESKMAANGEKYAEIMAEELKKEIG